MFRQFSPSSMTNSRNNRYLVYEKWLVKNCGQCFVFFTGKPLALKKAMLQSSQAPSSASFLLAQNCRQRSDEHAGRREEEMAERDKTILSLGLLMAVGSSVKWHLIKKFGELWDRWEIAYALDFRHLQAKVEYLEHENASKVQSMGHQKACLSILDCFDQWWRMVAQWKR